MTDGQWTDYKKRFRALLAMLRRAFASLSTVHKKTPMLRHHFLLRSVLFLITARERMKNSPHPSFEVGGAPHACIGQSHNHIKSITFKTAAAWAEWTRGFVCILAGEERSGGRISGEEDTPPPPFFFLRLIQLSDRGQKMDFFIFTFQRKTNGLKGANSRSTITFISCLPFWSCFIA